MRYWRMLLLLLIIGALLGIEQSPGQGQRAREGSRGHLDIDELIVTTIRLQGSGVENAVLQQTTADGPVTVAPLESTALTDSGTIARKTGDQVLHQTATTPRAAQLADGGGTFVLDPFLKDLYWITNLGASATFNVSASGTLDNGQMLRIRITSATPRTLSWDSNFAWGGNGYGYDGPTQTTGGGVTDQFVWQWNATTSTFQFLSTTQPLPVVGSMQLTPNNAQLPDGSGSGSDGEAPAYIDNSTVRSRIRFDNVTRECVFWEGTAPEGYLGTPVVQVIYNVVTVTTGAVGWDLAVLVDNGTSDWAGQLYDTANSCDDAEIPSTSGATHTLSCPLTNNDSISAGKAFKLKLCRDVAIGNNATNDAAFLRGLFTYAQ